MASTSSDGKPFSRIAGFATPNGPMFEVMMAALLFLRGLNSGLDFHLATNVKGAGATDDVVFRVTDSDGIRTAFFVQLKHRDTPGTPESPSGSIRKMLIDPKGKKSAVHSYFKAFRGFKNSLATLSEDEKPFFLKGVNFKDCVIVLFTNAVLEDVLSNDSSQHVKNYEKAVTFLGSGCRRILGFTPAEKKEPSDLENALLNCLSKSEDPKDQQTFDLKDRQEFLGQFLIFTGQSSVGDFNNLLKVELGKVRDKKVKNLDANRLCANFVHEMTRWWEKSCFTLHKKSTVLVAARTRTAVEDCSVLEKGRYCLNNLHYKESAHSMLNFDKIDKFSLIVVAASEDSFRLSYTKFHCATRESHLLLSIQGLLNNKDGVIWEIESGTVNRLVLCAKDLKPDSDGFLCLVEVCEKLKCCNGHVVIFSNESETLCDKLKEKFTESERITDTFNFFQLTKDSQDDILQKEFMHQNCMTTFMKLLGNDPSNAVFIDAAIVLQMITFNENVLDAPKLAENISYYIDRTLEETNVVQESYFRLHPTPYSNFVENSSIQHVQSILNQGDRSLDRNVQETLQNHFQACLLSVRQSNSSLLVGEHFAIANFKCNFIYFRGSIALQTRSTLEGLFSNMFVIQVANEQDLTELSKFNKSTHFFSLHEGVLYWKKSHAPVLKLAQYVDCTASPSPFSGMVNDISRGQGNGTFKLTTERKLGIICGEPGMGKSTLVTHVALEMKAQFPDYWIIVIYLNDHTALFTDLQLCKDALKYLLAAVFRSQLGLQEALFKIALEKIGNVVVLLDGYDEIAPRYVSECNELIKSIRDTKVKQVLVTSRNSIKGALEDSLMTFAAKLREFDEEDQRKFLKRYWKLSREEARKDGTEILSDEDLETFITTLLARTIQAINDHRKEFMSIPLQTLMVAEVYEDHVIADSGEKLDLDENIDVLNLLEKSVDKKWRVYLESRRRVGLSDTDYESQLDTLKRKFGGNHFAALVLILGEKDVERLHSKDIAEKSEEFLKSIADGRDKTGFIDRVVNGKPRFIHRVYAEYFVAKWFEKHYAENVAFLQQHLFTENFKVIREIFDLLLVRECKSKLHLAVLKANAVQVEKLLQAGAAVDETDGGGRTALHLAATLHSTIRVGYETFKKADADKILNLLVSRTRDFNLQDKVVRGSPLQYARLTKSQPAIDMLIIRNPDETSLSKQKWEGVDHETHNDNRQGSSSLAHAPARFPNEAESVRSLTAVDKNGQSPLHISTARLGGRTGTTEESSDLETKSLEVDNLPVSVLPGNTDVSLIDYLHKHAIGTSPLRRAVKSNNAQHVEDILNAFDQMDIGSEDAKTPKDNESSKKAAYINTKDKDGVTALTEAASKGNKEIVSCLINHGADVTIVNSAGLTALQVVVNTGFAYDGVITALLEALEGNSRADYVNFRAPDGSTALHHAVSVDTVMIFVEAGGDLTIADNDGHTPFMASVMSDSSDIVAYMLKHMVANGVTGYMDARNNYGLTVLHLAAYNGFVGPLRLLLEDKNADIWCLDGEDGGTPLHWAGKTSSDLLKVLLEACATEQEKYIDFGDEAGDTALHWAIEDGNLDSVRFLIGAGASVTLENHEGITPLEAASNLENKDIWNYLHSLMYDT